MTRPPPGDGRLEVKWGAYVLDLSANGLGAVRTLARAGVRVRGFDCDPIREGFRSRYGRPRLCPDPTSHSDALLEFLSETARDEPYPPLLLPANDKFAEFVAARQDELSSSFLFVLPPTPLFQALLGKDGTYVLASRLGLAVPRTANVTTGPDGGGVPDDFPYPALLKPALSYALWGLTRGKVLVVRDRLEANRVLQALPHGAVFALQEVIPGSEDRLLFYSTYRDRAGRVLAEFVSRKIRQYPPGFGTATLFESCTDPEVSSEGRRLFDGLGYRGLASVEFKRDPRDGRLKLIEVNPRLWLFHPLSVPAGVDFVLTAYRDATGQPTPRQTQAGGAVKWLLLPRDLAVAFFYWREGRLGLGAWLRSYCGPTVKGLWSVADPLPFCWSLGRSLNMAFRRLFGGGEKTAGSAVPELPWAEQMETLAPKDGRPARRAPG